MLECILPGEALEIILTTELNSLSGTETVSLEDSIGRVLAQDVFSEECIPLYNRSCVDGYALKAAETFGCSEALPSMLPCIGEIQMGESVSRVLKDGSCLKIPTGGRLPQNADSVVMLEYTQMTDDGFCCVEKPCAPYENVIRAGDDVKTGQTVLLKSTVITQRNIGILAALGKQQVIVKRKLNIAVVSTGDELVAISESPGPSQIRDINSSLLRALVSNERTFGRTYPIVMDKPELLRAAVIKALEENDILLLSGGTSVGEKDDVYRVLSELGEVAFHGISMKPGKPTMFAVIDKKPVFGLPGHPLAAYFSARLFALPLINKLLGIEHWENSVEGMALYNISSNHGREEILPVRLFNEGENKGCFEPIFSKSGVISVLNASDGYIRIDGNTEGIVRGEKVKVYLF